MIERRDSRLLWRVGTFIALVLGLCSLGGDVAYAQLQLCGNPDVTIISCFPGGDHRKFNIGVAWETAWSRTYEFEEGADHAELPVGPGPGGEQITEVHIYPQWGGFYQIPIDGQWHYIDDQQGGPWAERWQARAWRDEFGCLHIEIKCTPF